MPSIVIKTGRDEDQFVVWPTVTESPHGYGDRATMLELLRAGIRGGDRNPETVLNRAGRTGTSSLCLDGAWDDPGQIYKQTGRLPRHLLLTAARLQCDGRERDLLDLLEPLEDDDVDARERLDRRKRDTVNRGGPAGRHVAEDEVRAAGAAIAAVKEVFGR